MTAWARVRRFFTSTPMLICLMTVWGLALIAGVGLYAMKQRPDVLRDLLLQQVARLPGYSLSVGQVTPVLLPAPGIHAENVVLRAQNGSALEGSALMTDDCSVLFDWGGLLSGSFVPAQIALTNPYILAVLPEPVDVPDIPGAERLSHTAFFAALGELNGISLDLANADIDLRVSGGEGRPGKRLTATGLTGQLTMPSGEAAGMLGLNPGSIDFIWNTLNLEGAGPKLELAVGKLKGSELRLSRDVPGFIRTGTVNFSARGAVGEALRDVDLHFNAALAMSAGPPDMRGEFGIDGTALFNGVPVVVTAKIPFQTRDIRSSLDIRDAALSMENNRVSFTATWLAEDNSLTGKAEVGRLSLPRWFAFGRNLPAGLMNALDDISGSFTFRMNPRTLVAPDLKFAVRGIPFAGRGSVENFSTPVIRIEATTGKADINKIFPELVEPKVSEPAYAQPPLVGGGEATPEDPDVGFDIRLKSDEAAFWRFSGKEFELRLSPVWEGASIEGIRVEANLGTFYGGKLLGDFRAEDDFALKLQLNGVNGETLSKAMTGRNTAFFGGRLDVKTELRGRGTTLAATLAGLSGTLDATLTGGFFGDGPVQNRLRFTHAALRADNLRGVSTLPATRAAALPGSLTYSARWRTELVTLDPTKNEPSKDPEPPLSVQTDAQGRIRLSTDNWLPVFAENLLFSTTGRMNALPFALKGTLDGERDAPRISKLTGRVAGLDIAANLSGSRIFSAAQWQAEGSAATSSLREVLTTFDLNTSAFPDDALLRAEVAGTVSLTPTELRLEKLRGSVDDTTFTGTLRREAPANARSVPQWAVNLALDTLNADRYRAKTKTPPGTPQKQWDTAFMRETGLTGTVTINKLTIFDMPAANCRIPLRLANGVLDLSPITMTIANGTGNTSVRLESTTQGLITRIRSVLSGVNMLTLTPPADVPNNDKSALAGTGAFTLDIGGLVHSGADIPAAFNGTWSARVDNGYMASGNSRRYFRAISATGNMRSGVLNSSDLFVNGQNFMVRGGGTVNLVNNTLNYRMNASLPGVPDVPITYSGPLDDPRRSINAISALSSMLANVGKGVFSILDNVLSVPLRLIQ